MRHLVYVLCLLIPSLANAASRSLPTDDPARFAKLLFDITDSDRVQDMDFVVKMLGTTFKEEHSDKWDNWCGPYDNAFYQDIAYGSSADGLYPNGFIKYGVRSWLPCPASPRNHPLTAPHTTARLWIDNLQSWLCLKPDMLRSTGKVQVRDGVGRSVTRISF